MSDIIKRIACYFFGHKYFIQAAKTKDMIDIELSCLRCNFCKGCVLDLDGSNVKKVEFESNR